MGVGHFLRITMKIYIYIYIYGSRTFSPNHYEDTIHVALLQVVRQKTLDGQKTPVLKHVRMSSSRGQMSWYRISSSGKDLKLSHRLRL